MKKIILLALFILPALTQAQDFRNATWGESKEEVKARADGEFVTEKKEEFEGLVYELKININGYLTPVYTFYLFVEGRLVRTSYSLKENYTDKQYYDLHKSLNSILESKYEHIETDINWLNRSKQRIYEENPIEYPYVIGEGDLEIHNYFEGDKSKIQVIFSGDSGQPHISVVYESKEYGYLFDKASDAKLNRDF